MFVLKILIINIEIFIILLFVLIHWVFYFDFTVCFSKQRSDT